MRAGIAVAAAVGDVGRDRAAEPIEGDLRGRSVGTPQKLKRVAPRPERWRRARHRSRGSHRRCVGARVQSTPVYEREDARRAMTSPSAAKGRSTRASIAREREDARLGVLPAPANSVPSLRSGSSGRRGDVRRRSSHTGAGARCLLGGRASCAPGGRADVAAGLLRAGEATERVVGVLDRVDGVVDGAAGGDGRGVARHTAEDIAREFVSGDRSRSSGRIAALACAATGGDGKRAVQATAHRSIVRRRRRIECRASSRGRSRSVATC